MGLDSEKGKRKIMVEKCDTPDCLRGVDNKGEVCPKCLKGLPPMKNPKSPHAYTMGTSGGKSGRKLPKADIKPEKSPSILGVNIDKEKVKENGSKVTQNITGSGNVQVGGKTTVNPTVKDYHVKSYTQAASKGAVKTIFNSYWYGWPNGTPKIFAEIFADYGEFISDRVAPSKMVGNPLNHKSTINASGHKAFIILAQQIFPPPHRMSDERAASQFIEGSQIAKEALGKDIPTTHAIEFLRNNGKAFTFNRGKSDGSLYTYTDKKGKTWKIPRWAIA